MITVGNSGRIDRPYDTDTQPTVSSVKDYDGIIKGLKSIKNKYDSSLRERAKAYAGEGIEERTFDTDDDLMTRATKELDSKYTPKRTKTESSYLGTIASADRERSTLGDTYAESVGSIRDKERRRLASQAETAARRGMTDSSVARLQAEEISADAERAVTAAGKYYTDRVSALDDKIRRAKQSYDDAMRGYEISYAIELEKKMEKYRAQRDKLLSEYEKSVSEEEEKRIEEYLREDAAMNAAFEAENGDYAGEKLENYRERYEYVQSALEEMSPTERRGFLKAYDSILQDYLGLYYRKLREE